MVTTGQLALAVVVVGVWCVGWTTAGLLLALLNRKV